MYAMKIVQVISHYPPAIRFGGPPQVAHELGKALFLMGHDVITCTTNIKDEYSNANVEIDRPVNLEGVTVYYEPVHFLRYWGLSLRMILRLFDLIKNTDIVILHFHFQFATVAGGLIARLLNKRTIYYAHGSLQKAAINRKRKIFKSIYLRIFEKRNFEKSRYIVFNAELEKENSIWSEKGIVIPNGVNPNAFKYVEKDLWRSKLSSISHKIWILYLGRINLKQKGLNLLVPAFAKLVKCRKDIHLLITGPDERGDVNNLKQLIEQLNLQNNVTLTGMVEGVDRFNLLKDADVFALTSPSEGLSISLLEAMYSKLPLIVTNKIGLSDVIYKEKCGYVANVDVNDICQKMDDLLNLDIVERKNLGLRAYRVVEQNYTWDKIATKLLVEIK